MTDQPSEAALRKACEVLDTEHSNPISNWYVTRLARHFDAEDKAARSAVAAQSTLGYEYFTKRHILPDPKPTVQDVLRKHIGGGSDYDALAEALRDAGLLREGRDGTD